MQKIPAPWGSKDDPEVSEILYREPEEPSAERKIRSYNVFRKEKQYISKWLHFHKTIPGKVNNFLVVLLYNCYLANFSCGMDIFKTDYIKDQTYKECHKVRQQCYLVGFKTLSHKKMILYGAEQF